MENKVDCNCGLRFKGTVTSQKDIPGLFPLSNEGIFSVESGSMWLNFLQDPLLKIQRGITHILI